MAGKDESRTRPEPPAALRAFVAVPVPEDVRAALAREQARLQQAGARVGWVAPANIHVTLLFLGYIGGVQIKDLAAALDEAAAGRASFTLTAAGLGYFGSPRSPRVLWAGLGDPEHKLAALQGAIAERVRALGLKTEDRPYHPHVTLGRVRPGGHAGLPALAAALEQAAQTPYGPVAVERVLLMQSQIGPHGVRYTPLHEARLHLAGSAGAGKNYVPEC